MPADSFREFSFLLVEGPSPTGSVSRRNAELPELPARWYLSLRGLIIQVAGTPLTGVPSIVIQHQRRRKLFSEADGQEGTRRLQPRRDLTTSARNRGASKLPPNFSRAPPTVHPPTDIDSSWTEDYRSLLSPKARYNQRLIVSQTSLKTFPGPRLAIHLYVNSARIPLSLSSANFFPAGWYSITREPQAAPIAARGVNSREPLSPTIPR